MDGGGVVGCVCGVSAAAFAGHEPVSAGVCFKVSAMAAGLLADGVAPADAGAYGRGDIGGVCHDDAVAEATSH